MENGNLYGHRPLGLASLCVLHAYRRLDWSETVPFAWLINTCSDWKVTEPLICPVSKGRETTARRWLWHRVGAIYLAYSAPGKHQDGKSGNVCEKQTFADEICSVLGPTEEPTFCQDLCNSQIYPDEVVMVNRTGIQIFNSDQIFGNVPGRYVRAFFPTEQREVYFFQSPWRTLKYPWRKQWLLETWIHAWCFHSFEYLSIPWTGRQAVVYFQMILVTCQKCLRNLFHLLILFFLDSSTNFWSQSTSHKSHREISFEFHRV